MTGTTKSAAATQYTTNVGGGKNSISVETYRPSVIFVNEGDSVQFMNNYDEIHTVTFLGGTKEPDLIIPAPESPKSGPPKLIFNPDAAFPAPQSPSPTFKASTYMNSGILNKGDSWNVSFATQGTYSFLCLVHPGMTGSVTVLPAGVHVPTQAQRDAEAQTQLANDLAAGEKAASAVTTSKTPSSNGTSNWDVKTGPSAGQADVLRFLPAQLNIGAGDTVTWANNSGVPHTVTFLSGGPDLDLFTAVNQPKGPPELVLTPEVVFPSKPSQTYDGTGYYNSGFITADPALSTGGTTFSLTFTKPGTYEYICHLHDDQGMKGTIQVGPQTTFRPPATGSAGLAAVSSDESLP